MCPARGHRRDPSINSKRQEEKISAPNGASALFDVFWKAYPRDGRGRTRGNRARALTIFNQKAANDKLALEVIEGLQRARASANWLGSMLHLKTGEVAGQYIPYAEKFVREEQYAREWPPYSERAVDGHDSMTPDELDLIYGTGKEKPQQPPIQQTEEWKQLLGQTEMN